MNLDEKLVAQRAGSSIAYYNCHNPSWIDKKVPDALLEELCPCLMSKIRKIDSLWNHSGLSRKVANDLCLCTAMGVILSIKHNLQRFIQMAASKCYNSHTDDSNVHDELSICDK